MERVCIVCTKTTVEYLKRNMCSGCYTKWRRTNPPNPKPCAECATGIAFLRGLCASCYWRCKRQQSNGLICAECGKVPVRARGLCDACYQRECYRANPERKLSHARSYKRLHRKEISAAGRVYRETHRKEDNARSKRWRETHAKQQRTNSRRWQITHAQQAREIVHRYRARKRGATVAPVDAEAIYERDCWTCQICGKPVERGQESLDHTLPLLHGGTHEPRNVRLAHRNCNSGRRDRGPAQLRLI